MAARQQSGPRAPIVVMTADADAVLHAAEVGAEALVAKSFDLVEVLNLVGQIVPGA